MQRESSLLSTAKLIVIISSAIGLATVWGIAFYSWETYKEQKAGNDFINTTRTTITQAACARLSGNKLAQGDCYLGLAKTRRNSQFCGKIEVAELKSICYLEIAEIEKDYSICTNNNLPVSLMALCNDYFKAGTKNAAAKNEQGSNNGAAETLLKIAAPAKGTQWIAGGSYAVSWTPIDGNDLVDIKLYDNSASSAATRLVAQPSDAINNGQYQFEVPKYTKVGSRYQIEITEYAKDRTYTVKSEEFSIVKK